MSTHESDPKPQTDSARTAMLINRAYELAEKKLMDGTASSQIIALFLKMGTEREKVEVENLKQQNELSKAKTKAINDTPNHEKMFEEAVEAMKRYGHNSKL